MIMDPTTAMLQTQMMAQKAADQNDPYDQKFGQLPNDPTFTSLIDPKTGMIGSQYQIQSPELSSQLADRLGSINLNTQGLDKFRNFALSDGPSEYAQNLLQKQGLEQQNALQDAARNQASQAAQARTNMAMRGGINSGAAERLARSSMLSGYNQQQQIARQGMGDRLGIQANDAQQRVQALSQLPGMEVQSLQPQFQKTSLWFQGANADRTANMQAQQNNIANTLAEQNAQRQFDQNNYNQKMSAYGGIKQAQAQNKGGGCCFIFLEARYGNGTMDQVVRRFRDENMTERNRRGYYKLSEVLVPLMRKSKLVKFVVRATMTDPMVAYGKAHYGEGKLGILFKPVAKFWLSLFDFLGGEHPFIRENGETV